MSEAWQENEAWRKLEAEESAAVLALCRRIGFGRVMQLASKLWGEYLVERFGEKHRGGQHSVGPCAASLVECGCVEREHPRGCDWCGGVRQVTRRVRQAQEPR